MITQHLSSEALETAVKEVFEVMVHADLDDYTYGPRPVSEMAISSTITFNGDAEGFFTVATNQEGASEIALSMLGLSRTKDIDRMSVEDAMGEVANMVAGRVKKLASEFLGEIKLSIPTIICSTETAQMIGAGVHSAQISARLSGRHFVDVALHWRV